MNELVILDMRLFARRHFPARPPGRRKRLGDAQKLLSRPASAAARHARPRAAHPGGAFGDYPRTSALDARVNPPIKSGEVHDENCKCSAYFWGVALAKGPIAWTIERPIVACECSRECDAQREGPTRRRRRSQCELSSRMGSRGS